MTISRLTEKEIGNKGIRGSNFVNNKILRVNLAKLSHDLWPENKLVYFINSCSKNSTGNNILIKISDSVSFLFFAGHVPN